MFNRTRLDELESEQRRLRNELSRVEKLLFGYPEYSALGMDGVLGEVGRLRRQFDTLLDHLNLDYVPANTQSIPATFKKKSTRKKSG